ncbi:MAG TPA: MarR family transcriptional regulator [Vicinamibacterales bacterium]|nr:MarR family transcriptional regulator [Vicinamibacterales bacterium]
MGSLQHDLKQQRPFASPEEEAYLNLARTTDLLNREVAAVLKPHQLSAAQYNVLRILRGAGEAGHACSEIASRLVTRDPDVTRLLDKLEARELLARSREHADRRVVTARITAQGLALLDTLDRPMREAVERMLAHMPAAQLRTLTALLELARQAAPADAARATAPAATGAERSRRPRARAKT